MSATPLTMSWAALRFSLTWRKKAPADRPRSISNMQDRVLHIQVTTRWIERRCMDKYENFGSSPSRTLLWLRKLRKYRQKARRHP
jgi:hypothetical protein